MTELAWVIGARGLLGSALSRRIDRTPGWSRHPAAPMPWSDDAALHGAARRTAGELIQAASGGPWAVVWAAGAAVTASTPETLLHERRQLGVVLDAIAEAASAAGAAASGSFFYASSAGGVYAGAPDPPYTERSSPDPIAPYGRFKLDAEGDVRAFVARSGVPAVIGRISNLYGPGQRLDKMQGLISHLALAQVTPIPARIYVSLDTLRDYIFVDDGASLILDALDRLRLEAAAALGLVVTKNIASGAAVSIADLLGYVRQITKGHPNVMIGQSPAASLQARDLRIRSVVWPELDVRELTPLAVGMHDTIADIRYRMQRSKLIVR